MDSPVRTPENLRSMGVLDRFAVSFLPLVPRPLMRRLASRYIAGEELADAVAKLRSLAAAGHPGILDILGEDVEDEGAARAVLRSYTEALDAITELGLDANVSVKPTHVGLRLSEELAFELLSELLRRCDSRRNFLRVEMEDHTTTDATLRVFERLRRVSSRVGIVLQSRLFRTPEDIDRLAPGPLDVRVVKGIYLEPPAIAHVDPDPIRDAFVECSRKLLERGAFLGFATHDELLGRRLLAEVERLGLGRDRYEFQVLLGVREALWSLWRGAGHTVRVYVPYGPEWRPYSTRRLRKNPEIFRHVTRDLLRLGPR